MFRLYNDPPMVSVLIFTLNEEIHLPSCLQSLRWCDDIIVVDSGSTDDTVKVCQDNNIQLFEHEFEGFGKQRNWALDNLVLKHDWVLILDADERVPDDLAQELNKIALRNDCNTGAARIRRRFHLWGEWLRYSSQYPTWVVRLIHKNRVRYANRGHGETQQVEGNIIETQHDLIDENLKGIDEWFERQNRYARAEADYELAEENSPFALKNLWATDPLLRQQTLKRLAWQLPMRPGLFFVYSYLIKQGFRDGRKGFMFCLMKATYQRMIVVKKYDARRSGNM